MSILRTIIDQFPKRTQIKIETKTAKAIVWLSAAQGRIALRGKPVPRILIDNSVLWHGLTHTNAWISTGTKMWGGEIPVETGYSARVPVDYAAHNRAIFEREVPFFAPLARLAKDGRISLCTSVELIRERNRHSRYDPYQFGMNLWSKVPIQQLPDLPRSAEVSYCLGPRELREHWSKQGQIRHLLATADSEFLKLAKSLPPDHILDFYHLWTAKHYNCAIFLSTDSAFRRVLENNVARVVRERFAPVKVMKPSEYGKELNLTSIPHHLLTPLDADWFYEMYEPTVVDKQGTDRSSR